MVLFGLFSLAHQGREDGSGLSFLPRFFGERAGVRGRCTPFHVVRLITKFISFISKVLTHTQKHNFHYL